MTIDQLNAQPLDQAKNAFMMCCTASTWINKMVSHRPYRNIEHMQQMAIEVWNSLTFDDYMEAFSGHPKIGDPNSLKTKFKVTQHLAENEQSAVQSASDEVIDALAAANRLYEEKFGYIFIVCATGKSAEQMLELVRQRLENEAQQEIQTAAAEQAKITAIRIDKMMTTDQ